MRHIGDTHAKSIFGSSGKDVPESIEIAPEVLRQIDEDGDPIIEVIERTYCVPI